MDCFPYCINLFMYCYFVEWKLQMQHTLTPRGNLSGMNVVNGVVLTVHADQQSIFFFITCMPI